MKWRPGDCSPGDMIRVRLGEIYHYGIFASEAEVLQFGLPPIPAYRNRPDAFTVVASDIDVFSCGRIVEVGIPEKEERRLRFSPDETLRRARARLGEGGYDLLRNNCEHFAWECAFGQSRCSQTEEAQQRWRSRPVLDVYLAPVPADLVPGTLASPERSRELAETRNPALLRQRYLVWKVLEYAADRSFGLKAEELHFRKNLRGRWSCEKMEFSLSHTDGMVAVAVSNSPVGVDVENIPSFVERYGSRPDRTERVLRKIAAPQEADRQGAAALLYMWTGKESLFKARQRGFFRPDRTLCGEETLRRVVETEPPVLLSVSGERRESLRFFLYQNGSAHRLERGLLQDGKEGLCRFFG